MRRVLLFRRFVVAVFVLGVACSKKSTPPTAPPNPSAACSLSTSSLAFGSIATGDSAELAFTITNTGGGTLSGSATTSSLGYSIAGGASFSLAANQSATVVVRFKPPSTGSYPGAVTLAGTSCGSVTCTGAAQPSGPICRLSTGWLNFNPMLGACAHQDRALVITSAGSGILSGTVSSPCGQVFQIIGDPHYSLGPGQRDSITVRFSPGGYGSFSCWITTGCDSVYCSGSIERHEICGQVTPDVLDFGTVYVGQTVTLGATLTSGNMPFQLIWYFQDNPNFDPPSGLHVPQYDSFSCEVDFMPQTAGEHTAWFAGQCRPDFGGDGDYHPFACITARGTAVVAPGTPTCQLSSTSLNFGTVPVGSFSERTLTVTNSGGGVLNGTVAPSGCPEFVVQQNPRVSLGPGQSKTYTIRFTPTQRGTAVTCYAFPFHPQCSVATLTGQGQ